MKNLIVLFSTILIVASCKNSSKESGAQEPQPAEMHEEQAHITLKELWATNTNLLTPESVLYDKERDVIYVSNVNMNPWEKDGNGFLSKIDTEGNILELEWITGFDGPKGLGLVGNKLFIADQDKLVEVDVNEGVIVKKHEFPEGTRLNDITTGDDGTVYTSSSATEEVFKWKDGEFEIIVDGDLGRPNGLFFEPGKLLMLTSNSGEFKNIDLNTKEISTLADGFGAGDGLEATGTGDYIASNWQGQLFYVGSDWSVDVLLDTRDKEINTADIDYIIEKNMLLVPTFYDNRVVAYSIEK